MSTKNYPLFTLIVLLLASLACGIGAPTAAPPEPLSSTNPDPTVVPTVDYSTIYDEAAIDLENPEPASPGTQPLVGAPDLRSAEEQFVRFVAGYVNQEWSAVFADSGYRYTAPQLVFIDLPGTVQSACRPNHTSKGPFYCSTDQTIYFIQSELWDAVLHSRVGEIGDFATALIVAHEIGHHVQNLLGISEAVDIAAQELGNDQNAVNILSTQVERQADCLAGIWTYAAGVRGMMEDGDIEEGITILHHIGDDSLGEAYSGNYTHGSAQDRIGWFLVGYQGGDISQCNTFVETTTEPSPYDLIRAFFVYASSSSCEAVDDNVEATIATLRCTFDDHGQTVTVDYDAWSSEGDWLDTANAWSTDDDLVAEGSWESSADNGFQGPYLLIRSQSNNSLVFWGVDDTPLTGTLYWYENNDEAAEDWFLQYGNNHNLP